MNLRVVSFDKENWEEALEMKVHDEQRDYMTPVSESLATAYIKPWDEALDPYLIYDDELMIGTFYLSYTPESVDNYWIGGFFIDKRYQGRGLGRKGIHLIIDFVRNTHVECKKLKLCIVENNLVAKKLYESIGFITDGSTNKYNEIIYSLDLKDYKVI